MKRSHSAVVHDELFGAVKQGNLRNVVDLVDQGADIHARFDTFPHGTVTHVAAFYGHRHLLSFFLRKGLDVNATDNDDRDTPLHLASRAGRAEVVQFLLDKNADMHAVNKSGQKPIHTAARSGQKDVVAMFLNKGMDVREADGKGSTLLHLTCERANLDLVQLLVNYKADIYAKDGAGRKPIHVAAQHGVRTCLQFFLNRGMSVDEPDEKGYTMLHWVCFCGGLGHKEFLVFNNANIHAIATDGRKPIHIAVENGKKDVVEYFLDVGMSVGETDLNGQTVLHHAVKVGRLHVIQLLVDRIGVKPQLDTQDNEGKTPMHLCYGKPDILKRLLDAGARSDIKDHDGRTVVFYYIDGCIKHHQSCFQRPVLAKMHRNLVDIDDWTKMTAAHLVVKNDCKMNLIKLVLQHQKDLNIEDWDGETPINYLTRGLSSLRIDQQETLIRMFVDHGACLNVKDYRRIVWFPSLKLKLFTDEKFCSQCLVNKFNNIDLPMLEKLPSAMSLSYLEMLKLNSGQICQIERAVEKEIRDKGHCDVSKMTPPLLSILAIKSYLSHYRTS